MRRLLGLVLVVSLASCAGPPPDDLDLDSDPDLGLIDEDEMPEQEPEDTTGSEVELTGANVRCTKRRFLHFANYSFVAPLDQCVNGVCPNGCWGYQRRTSGFACDYDPTKPSFVRTRPGDGPFASYNEIKPLNANDATAVAACRAASGNRALRTYAVWNGAGWNNEGISAPVRFAELYGPQSEAAPHFWTWFHGSRGSFSPMANVSPETRLSFVQTKAITARICSATRTAWAGLYFYDPDGSGGSGMADWKREAIIRGMNYCTTH